MLIRIDDPTDERIAAYRAVRERDLAGRGGRFIAEGEVVLRVLLRRSRLPAESILISERRLPSLGPLLTEAPQDVPVYVAPQPLMETIVGFPIHRGILAVGLRRDLSPPDLLQTLPGRSIILGLIGIANHDNMGGIFRNAAAFGADAVLIDDTSCDPLYRKAIRVSVGASLIVPFARAGSAGGLLEHLRSGGFECLALSPAGTSKLAEVKASERTALLLGAEGSGLPATVLARVRTVRIPMAPGFDSLNVATASGIALHHLMSAH